MERSDHLPEATQLVELPLNWGSLLWPTLDSQPFAVLSLEIYVLCLLFWKAILVLSA